MATAAEVQVRDKIFIGGEWVDSTGAERLDVVNSTTEETMGTIPAGTAEDAGRAVLAARGAFDAWSQTPREERAGYLSAISAGLGERSDEIAATIARMRDDFGGFEHASLQVNFNLMPFDAALASMRLFAREVMPRFA